jgi:beta-lactamase regulating signal transducer with metallopeptidase domain
MIWTLSLVGKSTLVLGAAAAAAWALRRSSASSRHMLWSLALLGLVVLPALSAALPRLELPVLPAPNPGRTLEAVAEDLEWAGAPQDASMALPPESSWREWVLLAWLAGASLGLVHLATGIVFVLATIRRARPIATPEWDALLDEALTTLGVRRRLRLRMSDAVGVPFVWGYRSPVVLLPPEAMAWPAGRRRAVLLHELAHVARFDCVTQTLAYAVRACYWPHPLVWWAVSSLRRETERACDDRVLGTGAPAAEYARHLLEAARGLTHPARRLLTAPAGAERTRLGDRVVAILDEHMNRRVPAQRVTALLGGGTLLAIAVLAAVELVPARAIAGSPPTQASEAALDDGIAHEPLGCLVAGRYPEIDATMEPASEVEEARLYFFAEAAPDPGKEYWVAMTQDGSRFVGRLPKPTVEAKSVRYRIEVRRRDARVVRTDSHVAVVAPDESHCPKGVRIAPQAQSTEPAIVHSKVDAAESAGSAEP